MRAWLRRASSFRRLSLCCSIILFSSSIVFRLHSIDDICFRVQEAKTKQARQNGPSGDLGAPQVNMSEWIFTCVWSCIMSASIFMLDSLSSLISWSKCWISSFFSTPELRHKLKISVRVRIVSSVPLDTGHQSSLPLLALSLIVISSSECFFLMLCAFSGQPDKLVQWITEESF